jgi:hypothetical protein
MTRAGVNLYLFPMYYRGAPFDSHIISRNDALDATDVNAMLSLCARNGIEVYPLIPVAHLAQENRTYWFNNEPWLNMELAQARRFALSYIQEVLDRFPFGGVFLDYIRGRSAWEHKLDPAAVTAMVELVRDEADARGLPLGAAVFRSEQTAGWASQDWGDWLLAELVNFVQPMAYTDDDELRQLVEGWRQFSPDELWPRVALAHFDPERAKTAEEVRRQLDICKAGGFDNLSIWDDRYLRGSEAMVDMLARGW